MSKELMRILVAKMHVKLNNLVEECNYDLLNEKVQKYSRRMDKVLMRYNKATGSNFTGSSCISS